MANKKIEVVEEDEKIEEKPVKVDKKKLDEAVKGRGFASYDEAVEFSTRDSFKKLHKADQEEFTDWLRNLK